MILLPQSVVYRGTITGLRISSVDGTAFLDNCAALVPYADGNHLVEIYPSGGGALGLKGFLRAQGAGETYSDLIYGATSNGNMETGSPPTGWGSYNATLSRVADERTGGAGSYSINVNRSSASGYCYRAVGCTLGMLYTYGGYIKNVSATNGLIEYRNAQLISASGDWTLVSGYRTGDVTAAGSQLNLQISGSVGVDVRFDDVFLRQVLTPSATGCTIVSTKGGTTANFAYKHASFTYNASSYTVIVRKVRGDGTDEAVYIPQFTTDDVAGVTFGGFYVDKFIASQPSARNEAGDAWYDVAHSGAAGSVVPKSKRGVPVWDYINFPQAMIACANKGKGWHLISAFEWASLAFLSKKLGTMPHGGNNNVDPPADATYTTETAQLDLHLKAENATYNRALPGTGPITWAHNHLSSGVYDLNGLVNEWVCMMMSTDGHPYVPANLEATYTGSPYGRGTISGSGGETPTLTVDGAGVNWLKDWTVDELNGCYCYIAEAASGAGKLYAITDTTATTVVLTNGDAPGNGTATFAIFKLVATDITNGMTDGNKILTLRDADADLKAFALPATADGTGAAAYGNDGYYFDKAAARAARRGGRFSDTAYAGVFALSLLTAPSYASNSTGFRAAKAKGAP